MLCTAANRHTCLPSQERQQLTEAALVLWPIPRPVIRARPQCLTAARTRASGFITMQYPAFRLH